MTFHEACDKIIQAAKDKQGTFMQYAASYAEAGKRMHIRYDQQMQALYILSNLGRWKGDEALQVKTFLKEFSRVQSR